jgi:hypothetical protein
MQKEYRKLSGMGDPREPETVEELWEMSLHQHDPNVNHAKHAFWGTLYKRNEELAKFVHKQAFHYGNGKMTNAGFEKTIDEWGFAKLDVEDPRDLWLFDSLSGLGGMKTVDEILIRVRDLEENLGWEMDSGEPDFLTHRGIPRTKELNCKIQALLWAVRFEQHELRTEREILLRIENLREAWHPDIALSYGETCWQEQFATGPWIEELQWVLRESKPAIVDDPIDPEDLLENDDDGYW